MPIGDRKNPEIKRREIIIHLQTINQNPIVSRLFLTSDKKLPTCKPDSVFRKRNGYHLSVPAFTHRDQSAHPPSLPIRSEIERAALQDGIRGISACKVYPPGQLLDRDVGSYPTFSPFPTGCPIGSHFLWHWLFPFSRNPAVHRCMALCCPDFPTPLEARDR